MAYTSEALVESEFKSLEIESSGTAILSADVAEFITQAENYINAKVSKKYSTPLDSGTSPIGFSILRTISTYMVVCRIKKILMVKDADKKINQDVASIDYCKEAQRMLNEVISGDLPLSDATTANYGGVDSYNSRNLIENEFEVDSDQW